jgi:hypothetical protein
LPRDGAVDRLVTLSFAIEDALIKQDYEGLNSLLEAREEVLIQLEEAGTAVPAGTLANLREVDNRILKLLKITRDSLGAEIRSQEGKRPQIRNYNRGGSNSIDMAS